MLGVRFMIFVYKREIQARRGAAGGCQLLRSTRFAPSCPLGPEHTSACPVCSREELGMVSRRRQTPVETGSSQQIQPSPTQGPLPLSLGRCLLLIQLICSLPGDYSALGPQHPKMPHLRAVLPQPCLSPGVTMGPGIFNPLGCCSQGCLWLWPSQVGAQGCRATTVSAPGSLGHLKKPLNVIKVKMLALCYKSVAPCRSPFRAAVSTWWHYSAIKYIENYKQKAHNGFGVQTKPAPRFISQAEHTQYFIKIASSRLSRGPSIRRQ